MSFETDPLCTAELRAKIKQGKACLGHWLTISDPLAVEALAMDCHVDWVQVDLEHSGHDWHALQMILLAWQRAAKPLIVRVPSHERSFLGRVLDLGASGVLVPFVNTADEAAQVVAACRYPPLGKRGFAPRRASKHFTATEAYTKAANESVFVMVQIEHIQAVEHVESIVRVSGVDAIFIGPADLSFSLGVPLEWEHPTLLAAIRRAIQAGRDARLPVAMAVDGEPSDAVRWLREGVSMVTIGGDFIFMRQAIRRQADEVRRLLEAGG